MPSPWLYVISEAAGRVFVLENDGESIPVTLDNYRELVEDGRIVQDRYWSIRINATNVKAGDDLIIYTGDHDVGIVGYAKIVKVENLEDGPCLLVTHDLKKSRSLLKNPISAVTVRSWRLNLRQNVVSLTHVAKRLRILLSMRFRAVDAINVEEQDLTAAEIDQALRNNRLRFGVVPTDSQTARSRQRRGQARLRKLTVENYHDRCAVCDISDRSLLIASHIVGWAKAPEHRGNLANVICLCRIHDALFEAGYWSLGNSLDLLKRKYVRSKTIRQILRNMTSFRKPMRFSPARRFVKRHRQEAAVGKSKGPEDGPTQRRR
jgi:HNH endonuclease